MRKRKVRERRIPVTFTARVDEYTDYDYNNGFTVELPMVLYDCVKDGDTTCSEDGSFSGTVSSSWW